MGCKEEEKTNDYNTIGAFPVWARLIVFTLAILLTPIILFLTIWVLFKYIVLNNPDAGNDVANYIVDSGKRLFDKRKEKEEILDNQIEDEPIDKDKNESRTK